ncbi:MAG: aldolase/citrate lyase family protein [Pusillimonas sp.]
MTLTTDEHKVQKAADSNADVLILDLTDSVVPERKAEARERVVRWLSGDSPFKNKQVVVKPNSLWSEWGRADLEAIVGLPMEAIYYPDARSADEVRILQQAMDDAGSNAEIAVLLEMPQAFMEIKDIASISRVTTLCHAQGDLAMNLGAVLSDDRETMLFTAQQTVLVGRSFGLQTIDTIMPSDLKDENLVRRYIETSRRMGFDSCSTFYAPHVDQINAAFTPTEEKLAASRSIVERYKEVKRQGRAAYVGEDGKWITVHQYRMAVDMLERFT